MGATIEQTLCAAVGRARTTPQRPADRPAPGETRSESVAAVSGTQAMASMVATTSAPMATTFAAASGESTGDAWIDSTTARDREYRDVVPTPAVSEEQGAALVEALSRQDRTVTTLLEAMPYIQRFWGTTIVIKYGGAAMTSRRLQAEFARDVVLLKLVGMRPIVVHGGGPQVTKMLHRLGMDARFVRGHRVTDEATMEVAKMVLVGKVNKDLVGLVHRHGGTAVGLSGEDGRLLVTDRLAHRDEDGTPIDIGLVGSIREVNTAVLELLADGAIPIVASIGADEDGQAYNVNADTAAGALAAALRAEKLLLLTDVQGVLAPDGDEQLVVSECTLAELDALEAGGAIGGGMIPKVAAVRTALQAGVHSAHVVDGRVDHALLLEVLTDAGCGTKVVP